MMTPTTKCRGLEIIKGCKRVFLEAYTSILMVDKQKLVNLLTPYMPVYTIIIPIFRFDLIAIAGEILWKRSNCGRQRAGGVSKLPQLILSRNCLEGKLIPIMSTSYSLACMEDTNNMFLVQEADQILQDADKEDIAFLVVGDPFG